MKKIAYVFILPLSLLVLLSSNCNHSKQETMDCQYRKVILIGMDGLDFKIVSEMIEQGQLPHFAKLAEQGTFKPLTPTNPAISPVVWSSIATGTLPEQHGIHDFLHRNPKTYIPYLSLRKSESSLTGTKYLQPRKHDGFWTYTSKANIPTTVVRWPVSFPAEKINGNFLSGLGVPDLVGNEGSYTFYTSKKPALDDPSPHNVMTVAWDGACAQMSLHGPATGRDRFAELSLSITKKDAHTAQLSIGDMAPITISKGDWSGWTKISFRIGFRKIHGMIKFLLLEMEPDLRLYASPINIDPTDQALAITYPEKYGKELADIIGLYHTLGMPEMIHPLSHGRYGYDEFLAEIKKIEQERIAMFDYELSRFDDGLLAFVFDHTDRVQHAFWSTRDQGHPLHTETVSKYSNVIPDLYRTMDTIVGKALNKADEHTLVMIVSDHGFNNFCYNVHLNRWLIQNGYMTLKDNTKEGRGLFQDVDWSKTKAYAVGFASIYINLAGREGHGIVQPGEECTVLSGELAKKLNDFKDPRTGAAVVHKAYISTQHNDLTAPDIRLGFKPNYRMSWQTALGGAPVELIDDNTKPWSGDHIIDPELVPGIFLCNKKLASKTPHVIDIAPTVLNAIGIKTPSHMAGKALQ